MGIPNEEFVVALKNTLHILDYTRILEPTMDLAIGHSIVTSTSVKSLSSLLDCKCQSHFLTHAESITSA